MAQMERMKLWRMGRMRPAGSRFACVESNRGCTVC